MKTEIQKKIKEIAWITEHSLTLEQRNKLIMDKVERIQRELDNRKQKSESA
jgi:hypothetical protein